MHIIIKRTERDHREAADRRGLSRSRYSGIARSEDEALEITRTRGDRPNKPLAFDDGGADERHQALKHGVTEEAWEKRASRQTKGR